MSTSMSSGRLAYTVFANGGWNIYSLDPNKSEAPDVTIALEMSAQARLLPPQQESETLKVAEYLSKPEDGLPPDSSGFKDKEYSKKLKLTYVGPPTIGVGVDRYGVGLGGSVSLGFSDVLGNHTVGVFFQGTGSKPPSHKGWHRAIRLMASQLPRLAPWRWMASRA